jgi:hypothetical protein
MARSDSAPWSALDSNDSSSPPEHVNPVAKPAVKGNDDEAKDDGTISLPAIEDAAAIPKGTLDPVYEGKARVLNNAVLADPKFPRS